MILRFLHLVQHPAPLSQFENYGHGVRVWKPAEASKSTANAVESLKPRIGVLRNFSAEIQWRAD
jgi:hypothetical protein